MAGGPGELELGRGVTSQRLSSYRNATVAQTGARRGGSRGINTYASLSCCLLVSGSTSPWLNQTLEGKEAKRSSPRRAAFEVRAGHRGW